MAFGKQRRTIVVVLLIVITLFGREKITTVHGFGGTHPIRRLALRELRAIDAPETATKETTSQQQQQQNNDDSSTIQVVKENQVMFGEETTSTEKTNDLKIMRRSLLLHKSLSRSTKQKKVHKKTRQVLLASKTKIENTILDSAAASDSYVPLRPSAGVDTFEQFSRSNNITSMSILGDRPTVPQHPLLLTPPPGTVLCQTDDFTIRTATLQDDHDIALLRLSVFSDFTPQLIKSFCARSKHVLRGRRERWGATCLVVLDTRSGTVLGSMECSIHEFYETALGYRRPPQSCLYMTEVAVHPNHRRRGIGRLLLQSLDKLVARYRPYVESLYLHVDVKNEAALHLYHQAGYQLLSPSKEYDEFTFKLNLHDGATRGRNHYLLCKNTVAHPTWHHDLPQQQQQQQLPTQ